MLRRLFVISLLLTLAFPLTVTAVDTPAWYSTDWTYRQKITVNHEQVAGSVDAFPMLVKLTGKVFEKAQNDGDDILFTSADGTTKLLHEIESMDGEVIAWVQMPHLSEKEDTILYVYYGNPTAENQQSAENVWGNGYLGVWHLGGDPSATQEDVTKNNFNGTPDNFDTQNGKAEGKIGSALNFDGVDDLVDLTTGPNPIINAGNQLTVTALVYAESRPTWSSIVKSWSGPPGQVHLGLESTDGDLSVYIDTVDGQFGPLREGSTTPFPLNTWHSVATVADGSSFRLYRNGQQVGTTMSYSGNFDDDLAWTIGSKTTGAQFWDGKIDHVTVSNVPRSSAWIKTEYNNQSGREDFLTIAEPETRSSSIATTTEATTTTLTSPLISAINRLFTFVYDRLPTFTEWKFWADRVLAGDKDTFPELLGAMQWQQAFGGSTPTVAGISSDAAAGLNVEIRNGTNRHGLAGRTLQKLSAAGYRVTAVGNAQDFSREQSKVYVLNHSDYAEAAELGTLLSIPVGLDLPAGERESSADVLVVLGADFGE